MTAPAQRTVLVVDMDGELLVPLRTLEEVLLSLAMWEADDLDDPPEDRIPLQLPRPLADGEALDTVQRLSLALAPTQSRGPNYGRLLGPTGSYEHAPLSVITLASSDIETLSATAAALGHPGLDPDIADVVAQHCEPLYNHDQRADHRTQLVSAVARLAGLLDLAPTEDTQLLVSRISANPPELDLALTEAEEHAYTRTADRMNAMWAYGSGIDRYLY